MFVVKMQAQGNQVFFWNAESKSWVSNVLQATRFFGVDLAEKAGAVAQAHTTGEFKLIHVVEEV